MASGSSSFHSPNRKKFMANTPDKTIHVPKGGKPMEASAGDFKKTGRMKGDTSGFKVCKGY